ncbi:MAG: hypothetical protein VCC00_14105 [Deltaproteobacteria bacterium]
MAAALATLLFAAFAADARNDILPFGLLYGSPEIPEQTDEVLIRVWSQGGRIHLRFIPDGQPHEIDGSLLATGKGVLKDTTPLSDAIRIRQPRPARLDFDGRLTGRVEGLGVILAGDFQSLIFDIKIDGRRQPEKVRIGGDRDRPRTLPVEFALGDPAVGWLDRFGF